METVRERLDYFIGSKKLNNKQFETICGLSNGMVSKVKDKIRLSTLQKIAQAFPDLNTEWLRTGEGEMLKEISSIVGTVQSAVIMGNHNTNNNNIDNRHYYSDSPDVLKAQIDLLDERIKEKDAQIKEKDAQIKEKDAQIRQLLEILKTK